MSIEGGEFEDRILRLERQAKYLWFALGAMILSLAFLGLSHTDLLREFDQHMRTHHTQK